MSRAISWRTVVCSSFDFVEQGAESRVLDDPLGERPSAAAAAPFGVSPGAGPDPGGSARRRRLVPSSPRMDVAPPPVAARPRPLPPEGTRIPCRSRSTPPPAPRAGWQYDDEGRGGGGVRVEVGHPSGPWTLARGDAGRKGLGRVRKAMRGTGRAAEWTSQARCSRGARPRHLQQNPRASAAGRPGDPREVPRVGVPVSRPGGPLPKGCFGALLPPFTVVSGHGGRGLLSDGGGSPNRHRLDLYEVRTPYMLRAGTGRDFWFPGSGERRSLVTGGEGIEGMWGPTSSFRGSKGTFKFSPKTCDTRETRRVERDGFGSASGKEESCREKWWSGSSRSSFSGSYQP